MAVDIGPTNKEKKGGVYIPWQKIKHAIEKNLERTFLNVFIS